MEIILSVWNFLMDRLFLPIWTGVLAFWNGVLVPLWTNMVEWVKAYIPSCQDFADFCFALFKLKYNARVYSFMIMLPIAVVCLMVALLPRRRRRRKKHDRH